MLSSQSMIWLIWLLTSLWNSANGNSMASVPVVGFIGYHLASSKASGRDRTDHDDGS